MPRPKNIIVHCSDSRWGAANDIDAWHRKRGFGQIGYHYVIGNGYATHADYKHPRRHTAWNGYVWTGRHDGVIGAHCLGFNNKSIGICLIGRDAFTDRQIAALIALCSSLAYRWEIPIANILGHYETRLARGKTCPNLEMITVRRMIEDGYVGLREGIMKADLALFCQPGGTREQNNSG